jgi:hypothetical protein
MKIDPRIYVVVGMILIGTGMICLMFSMWQLDLMLSCKVWGPDQQNIQFYTDLLANGYPSMSWMPWSINFELFPKMTAGVAYDSLMIMNICSWFFTASGAYLISKVKIQEAYNKGYKKAMMAKP